MSVVHKHRFPSVEAANAFVCGVNWVQNLLYDPLGVNEQPLEVQDILVGEEFGDRVATVVVLEIDDEAPEEGADEDHDHREHV